MAQYTKNDPKLLDYLSKIHKVIDAEPGNQKIKDDLKKNFSEQIISGYIHDGLLPSEYTICRDANGLSGFGIGYRKEFENDRDSGDNDLN